MRKESSVAHLPLLHKVVLIVLPWSFLAVVALLIVTFVWPRLAEGHALTIIVGVVLAIVGCASTAAAVVFSLDVISGRYPRETSEGSR